MNFFKQAQEFAASAANTTAPGGDNTAAAPGTAPAASGDGGFGNLVSEASSFLKSQGAAPTGDGSAAPPAGQGTLPGGRTPPTNQELLHSGEVLFDAVQGQKVDQSQLAGAASDILGGLAAHGNIDQGTYGKYINQAEEYLDKYAAKGQPAAGAGAPTAGAGAPAAGAGAGAPAAPAPAKGGSQVPTDSQSAPDQSGGSLQSPPGRSANPGGAPVNSGSTNDYAPGQQTGGPSPGDSQY